MQFRRRAVSLISSAILLYALAPGVQAADESSSGSVKMNQGDQQFSPSLYQDLRWRCIGPFRGGRTVAATGVAGKPNLFYIGVNNGGVWKSTDYGHTWTPIFDGQPTGSVGALAVAPSDSGEVH